MARAQGARALMALAFETTYGTPPASGFTRMPFASTSLGAEQPLLNSELLGYGRDPLAPIKDAVTADGDVVVPLDAEAIRRDQAAHHTSRSQPVYRQNITGCDDIVIRHGLVKEYVWKLCRERRQAAKHPAERPEDETIPKRRRRE